MLLQPSHFALRIIQVSKYDRLSRASLLASGDDFPVTDAPILLFRSDPRPADALNAVSAFFHRATPADGHIRVEHRLDAGRVVVRVLIEVESPNFVRAIVRTKTRPDTAIVHLKVQPFVIVDSRFDWADQFTR